MAFMSEGCHGVGFLYSCTKTMKRLFLVGIQAFLQRELHRLACNCRMREATERPVEQLNLILHR